MSFAGVGSVNRSAVKPALLAMPVQTAQFKVFYPEWQDAFEYWREVAGLDIVAAWRQQAKLIAERLIGGVGGASNWNRATPPGTRQQGENALVRDIYRAVKPLKAEGFRDVKVRKRVNVAVRDSDIPALQELIRSGVFGSAMVTATVLPAGNEFTAHQNSRRSRGRVTTKHPGYAVPGDAYLKAYVKEAKATVGNGKGGWVPSLFALGGTCNDWISRHARAGTCVDNLRVGQEPLNFSMINRSKWAEGGDEDRIIDTVMKDRAEAIQKDIAYRLESSFAGRRRQT